MDLPTTIFVLCIFLASLLLTVLIRHDFQNRARLGRELQHPRRRPARPRDRLDRGA